MNKNEIQELLHHRDPYLMIDSIEKLDENLVIATKSLKNEFFFKGHFPGAEIVPGAMMQEMTTQAAGLLITNFYSPVENYNSNSTKGYALGVLKKIGESKFKGFAKPNDVLTIEVELKEKIDDLFEFNGRVKKDNVVIMKNNFQLVNISDEHLY